MINIKIRLFAAFREIVGKSAIDLTMPENSTIRDAAKTIESSYPGVKNILSVSRYAVNMEYQDVETVLHDKDELTVIMPVSGGANSTDTINNTGKIFEANDRFLIEIADDQINDGKVMDFISSDKAGSILLFNGTVRDNEDGKSVKYLFYEAYLEMAQKEIKKLIEVAFKNYELLKVAVIHRTGKILIGELSISIGISSPHRDDSYRASRFLIDNIKETVPIWKKESFSEYDKWKKIPRV